MHTVFRVGFVTASTLQTSSAFLLLRECPASLKKCYLLQRRLWAPYLQSYLFAVHFISFSSFSAVSLYPTRATLPPLDLPQNDLSVKSDPLSLSRTDIFLCQSLTNSRQVTSVCPLAHHSSNNLPPHILDSNSRFC